MGGTGRLDYHGHDRKQTMNFIILKQLDHFICLNVSVNHEKSPIFCSQVMSWFFRAVSEDFFPAVLLSPLCR